MFARQNPALLIEGVTVGEVTRLTVDRHTGRFGPTMHTVTRNVGKRQVFLVRVPDWPFRESESITENLEFSTVVDYAE